MNVHPTSDELRLFLHGGLRAERVAAVAAHLEQCRTCATAAMPPARLANAGPSLARAIDPSADEHPFVETLLTSYVDGSLTSADRATVEEHLEHCPTCREDVADLRAMAALVPSRRVARWPFIAAVAAALVLALTFFLTRETRLPQTPPPLPRALDTAPPSPPSRPSPVVPPTPQNYARADWTAAVAEALRRGALAMPPVLADLQLAPDPERAPVDVRYGELDPVAAILEETRPRFRWTPTTGATYVLSIFDRGKLIAESPALRQPNWQPPRELPRGRVYQWQVSVRGPGGATILPAPPEPPALFRVLDAAAHAELDAARAAHPNDALLLGVLYARHGLRAEAEHQLNKVRTPIGRALLRSVQRWPSQGLNRR